MPEAARGLLRHRDGVISTHVGYAGGENDNPTAGNHPGHAEAVKVIFDPERTSYRDILEFSFQIHRPDLGEGLVGSDYRSEIFYTSDEQRQVAEDTIADTDASGLWPGKVVTKISQAGPFWAAEAEDQDYLQHYPTARISSIRSRPLRLAAWTGRSRPGRLAMRSSPTRRTKSASGASRHDCCGRPPRAREPTAAARPRPLVLLDSRAHSCDR
jgi:peptide-methionine (S)-S-oxide reductase